MVVGFIVGCLSNELQCLWVLGKGGKIQHDMTRN